MARIAAGALKGMPLRVPRRIRATQAQVRQALFNILGNRVRGARVIDAFAGSGALGLEALSRGAGRVVFLESHPAGVKAIRENLIRIKPGAVPGEWLVMRGDALHSLRRLADREHPFDLLILDPPYEEALGEKALNVISECGMLTPAGIVCLEHSRRHSPPQGIGALIVRKQHRYGETVLSFYHAHQETAATEPRSS